MQTLDLATAAPRIQSFLVLGMEGSGKTRFIGTCPRPILLYSFDGGYRTLAGEPGVRCKVFLESSRQKPRAAKEFEAEFQRFLAGQEPPYEYPDGRKEPFKTIALDPLSSWSLYQLLQVQYANGTVESKPTFTEYDLLLKRGIDMVNQCLQVVEQSGAVLVCTAHLKPDKDEETGQLWFLPDMIGGTREVIGRYFDCVAILKTDKKPDGQVQYQFCVVGERRERARLRLPASLDGVIKAVDVPDFAVISARINGAVKPQEGK